MSANIYEIDKRAAEVCRDMQINGFAFDRERAAVLSSALRDRETAAIEAADVAANRRIKRTKSGGLSTKDLAVAFFEDLGAPVFFRSELTGAPSLGVDAMRAYAACKDERLRALALAILDMRRARKIRATYIDAAPVGSDGRVHPTWLNYGAVSGRWACQGPNLMNLPRAKTDPTYELGGVRSLYWAEPGNLIVAFDASQLEMRIAAYVSGDPAMIAACESSDLHSTNATIIFPGDFDVAAYAALKALASMSPEEAARFKFLDHLRTLAKTSGFAVCYLAEAATVYARLIADGVTVQLRQCNAMIGRLHRQFHVYYAFQDEVLNECIRTGYVSEPVTGRRRWLGHVPAPTECANFPIQGGAAGLMNMRLPAICDRLAREIPGVRAVAQVHDSGVFEVPARHAQRAAEIMREVFEQPVTIDSSGKPLTASFPIEIKIAERWK